MRKITPTQDTAPDDAGATLTLTAEQLKAMGLRKPPVAGATVQLRATATVADSDGADAVRDRDHDAAADAAGGDDDAEAAGDSRAAAPALTLRLTALTLIQPHKTPDKVLYGSGD